MLIHQAKEKKPNPLDERLAFKAWCRRGDSNPHELPHTPLKRARLPVPPLRLGKACLSKILTDYFVAAGDAAGEAAGDAAVLAFVLAAALGAAEACGLAAGLAAGVAAGVAPSSGDVCMTERWPESAGIERINATSIKSAAAPIVILASKVCVPRGPKAVLETLLAKSAPASALPGCKSTVMMSTMQAKIKSPYKT
jgi:hypothetical protein